MSRPANSTRPIAGACRPVMTLNNVVLPAPLGPISPVTDRSSTLIVAPSTATRPPKRTVTSLISSRLMRCSVARDRCGFANLGRLARNLVRDPEVAVDEQDVFLGERTFEAEVTDLRFRVRFLE